MHVPGVVGGGPRFDAVCGRRVGRPAGTARASGDDFGTAILYFSLLAVGTSLLGFATGLVDFFGDLQGLDGDDRPPYLWAAALAPPAAISAHCLGTRFRSSPPSTSPACTVSLCCLESSRR